MSEPRKGQRWRYTFEGVVVGPAAGSGLQGVYLRLDDADARTVYLGDILIGYAHAERLPDPEPDWQPGDIAAHYSEGGQPLNIYRRIKPDGAGRVWRWPGTGARFSDDEVPRPLVRLVPEGQS